jgi:hypothetical protein
VYEGQTCGGRAGRATIMARRPERAACSDIIKNLDAESASTRQKTIANKTTRHTLACTACLR